MPEVHAAASGGAERMYEIGFDGDVADLVERAVPAARVLSRPTCTVLWHHMQDADELNVLLDALMTLGITPLEVYEAACEAPRNHDGRGRRRKIGAWGGARRPTPSTYCEVRVEGCLGDAILSHLRWSHRVVQTTVVRIK